MTQQGAFMKNIIWCDRKFDISRTLAERAFCARWGGGLEGNAHNKQVSNIVNVLTVFPLL